MHDWIEIHAAYLVTTGQHEKRELARAAATLNHIVRDELMAALLLRLPAGQMSEAAVAVARHTVDPYTAAAQILAAFLGQTAVSPGSDLTQLRSPWATYHRMWSA